jgi:hypothetical protein
MRFPAWERRVDDGLYADDAVSLRRVEGLWDGCESLLCAPRPDELRDVAWEVLGLTLAARAESRDSRTGNEERYLVLEWSWSWSSSELARRCLGVLWGRTLACADLVAAM